MKKVSNKDIQDGLAWLRGDIGLNELASQRGIRHSRNILPRLAVYIREAYRKGRLS